MTDNIATLAALINGDRWLDANACALFLGLVDFETGEPNRRKFLEQIACRPDFPKQNAITKTWRKKSVEDWAINQDEAPFRKRIRRSKALASAGRGGR